MRREVTDADTAAAVGSGDVAVLATPRLIAWLEAATVASAAPFVGPGQTSVGTAVRIEHRRATPVGTILRNFCASQTDIHLPFMLLKSLRSDFTTTFDP